MRVLCNGNKSEYFETRKGLRLGDPLSPYLFVVCIDKLYDMIRDVVEDMKWDCMKAGRSGPKISHTSMIFADY